MRRDDLEVNPTRRDLDAAMNEVKVDLSGYSKEQKKNESNQRHKNVIEIIKSKISRTKAPDTCELNPTKAALYGMWIRL